MNPKKPILFAVLAAFFSFFLIFGFLKSKEARFNSLEEPLSVVVAKKDILQGFKMEESFVEIKEIPKRFVQPAALSSLASITAMVSAAPILKGEQILETKLVSMGPLSGLAVRIPQGFRALSIEVDDASGVSGLVHPNNFVDLLATFEMEDSSDTTELSTHTLAEKVLVLAVGDDFGFTEPIDASVKTPAKKSILGGGIFSEALHSHSRKTVTLALTPKQVQEVAFAKEAGKLSLSLRAQWAEEPLNLSPTTALDVVGFKGRIGSGKYREYRGR